MNYRLLFAVWILVPGILFSRSRQAPGNDSCSKATLLSDVTGWCSSPRQFTTDGATASGVENPGCFPSFLLDPDHDVWFKFKAVATSVNISVIGAISNNPKGTIQFPQLALYRGDCKSGLLEIACISDSRGNHIVETFVNSLAVGGTYFLRIDGRNGKKGSFQLCVNNFNPVPSPSSDCATGVVLCDKSAFTIPSVSNAGKNRYELPGAICLQEESQSAWYKWTCEKSGTLSFTLTPINPSDDLDFALFLLPNGVNDCSNKINLRCMASGENVSGSLSTWIRCTGSTGLRPSSIDLTEEQGCDEDDDNFLAPLNMETGKSYALVVNNYHNTGNGFSVEFGGTGAFVGPKAHFTVSELKVEKGEKLFIKNASSFSGGIKKWEWNFGVDAKPQTAKGEGPHTVTYSSVGKKSISLLIETGNGCQVTKVRHVEVVQPPPPPKAQEPPKDTLPAAPTEAQAEPEEELAAEEPPIQAAPPEMKTSEAPVQYDTTSVVVTYAVKYVATIYFKADSASLEAKDFETLEKVQRLLLDNAEYQAIVEGYTNNIPSADYCLKLGAERADGVISWLRSRGIGDERIIRKVFGKTRTGSKLDGAQHRKRHQRVEIKIVKREG